MSSVASSHVAPFGRMAREGSTPPVATVMLPWLVAAGSLACGWNAHARDLADAPGVRVTTLPLEPGYYVASDTPCGEASNATVSLLRRTGIGGARDFCEFTTIEQTGPSIYRVTQSCQESQPGGATSVAVVTYVLSGNARFVSRSDQGWSHSARRCSQSTMPPEWRPNDIRDLSR